MSEQNPFEDWLKGQVDQAPIPNAEDYWKLTKKSIELKKWKKIGFLSIVISLFFVAYIIGKETIFEKNTLNSNTIPDLSINEPEILNSSINIKPDMILIESNEKNSNMLNKKESQSNHSIMEKESYIINKSILNSLVKNNTDSKSFEEIEKVNFEKSSKHINLPLKSWIDEKYNEISIINKQESDFIPELLDRIKYRSKWIPYLTVQGGIQNQNFAKQYYSLELGASYKIIPNWTINIGIETATLNRINLKEEINQIDYGFYVEEKNFFVEYQQVILLNIPVGISYYLGRNTFSGYIVSSYVLNAKANVYQSETNTGEFGWGYTENFNRFLLSSAWSYEYSISKNWNLGFQYTYGFTNMHTLENNTRLQGIQLKVKRWW